MLNVLTIVIDMIYVHELMILLIVIIALLEWILKDNMFL